MWQRSDNAIPQLAHPGWKSDVSSPAHALIDPEPFYNACLYDWCTCQMQDKCLCDVLSAYAHRAREKGITLDWQRENYCAISCPRGAYYAECTPPCEVTCQSINSLEAQECVQSQCVPGCKCPAGMVLHDFECISISDCPEQ
ncbi:kielin/chordin-like protein isoform X2 [Asterias amurensis]|uniref:kielin/chordin-like protein isoform X2 n=1 Tax=Asterias amurensis TaxID=7602 RepID=UPI003AB5E9FF